MSIRCRETWCFYHGGGGGSGVANRVGGGSAGGSKNYVEPEKVTIAGRPVTVERGVLHYFSNGTSLDDAAYQFESVVYTLDNGTKIYFKADMSDNQSLTPEQLIRMYNRINPAILNGAQKEIEVMDYENPKDEYWRKTYTNFTRSYMTGGDKISIYGQKEAHDDEYLLEAFSHEIGHGIDTSYSGKHLGTSRSAAWKEAMRLDSEFTRKILIENAKKTVESMKRQGVSKYRIDKATERLNSLKHSRAGLDAVSTYGRNDPAEDFADSVSFYSIGKTDFYVRNESWSVPGRAISGRSFSETFPHRAAILKTIVASLGSASQVSGTAIPVSIDGTPVIMGGLSADGLL